MDLTALAAGPADTEGAECEVAADRKLVLVLRRKEWYYNRLKELDNQP